MTTFRPHWRGLVPAALFSAAVALGTVGYPAIASAKYDSFKFLDCMEKNGEPDHDRKFAVCCEGAGGFYAKDKDGNNVCYSEDPSRSARLDPSLVPPKGDQTLPPLIVNPDMPTANFTP
jgi:hypothetical protein